MVSSLTALLSPIRLMLPEPTPLPGLQYPLTPTPRVVVLGRRLRPDRNIVSLPDWRSRLRAVARAEALAGSLNDLLEVAELTGDGRLTMTHLSFPLIVISDPHTGCMTAADHDRLWNALRLPVLEQMRDINGRLIAYECEARDGFHIGAAEVGIPGATTIHGVCGCAVPGVRVRIPERRA